MLHVHRQHSRLLPLGMYYTLSIFTLRRVTGMLQVYIHFSPGLALDRCIYNHLRINLSHGSGPCSYCFFKQCRKRNFLRPSHALGILKEYLKIYLTSFYKAFCLRHLFQYIYIHTHTNTHTHVLI